MTRTTATSPWASERPALTVREPGLPWVLLGVAGSKRTRELQASRAGQGLPLARLVEWRQALAGPTALAEALNTPCVLKIEPPGDDAEVEHALRVRGAALRGEPTPLPRERTQLAADAAWFEGFSEALQAVAALLAERPEVRCVNAPAEILAMTDKLQCQQRLAAAGVPTPILLGEVTSFETFLACLDTHGLDRAYLKARHGSSAAGVLAFRRAGGRQQATTSAELDLAGPQPRLFNRKRLCRYERSAEIAQVVDLIAAQGAYAEAWVPKPRAGSGHYDLRLLALGGTPAHRVARVGERMLTNLHLEGRRADPASLMAEADLARAAETVRAAARVFPRSAVIGFDLVPRRGHAPWVLEANAFGDLLPGLRWQGLDPHAALHRVLPPAPQVEAAA